MSSIEDIFSIEPTNWLDSLPNYQKKIIDSLYLEKHDYNEVAKIWLSASMPTTVPFGAETGRSIFFEKVLDEIEAFFTDDEKYKANKLSILKESGAVQNFVVGIISVSLAPVLGASAVFLAPVIAIVLLTISKIGLNAWLSMRKDARDKND